jgi:hypothetical protein
MKSTRIALVVPSRHILFLYQTVPLHLRVAYLFGPNCSDTTIRQSNCTEIFDKLIRTYPEYVDQHQYCASKRVFRWIMVGALSKFGIMLNESHR